MQVTLSTREMPGFSKDDRADIKYYTRFLQCDFSLLAHMLAKDYMYSPFNYVGHRQGKSTICSEANFVVLDVDHTSISINSRIELLVDEGLQCILGTTSDPANLNKYRILLPLSRPVTALEYRYLVMGIASKGLVADMDMCSTHPSRKFYSYSGSRVLHSFIGGPLVVADYILTPSEVEPATLDPGADISSFLPGFDSYRAATKGKRTRSLLSAAYTCIEYGMNDTQLEQVVMYVNSLFLVPKSHSDIKRRVLNFIKTQRRSS